MECHFSIGLFEFIFSITGNDDAIYQRVDN